MSQRRIRNKEHRGDKRCLRTGRVFFSPETVNPKKIQLHIRAGQGGDGASKSLLSFQTMISDPMQLGKHSYCPFRPSHLERRGKAQSHSPVATSAHAAAGPQVTRGLNQSLHKEGPSPKGPISSCTKDFLSNLSCLQGRHSPTLS